MAIHTQPLSLKLKNLQAIADEEYSAVNLVEEAIHKFSMRENGDLVQKLLLSKDFSS